MILLCLGQSVLVHTREDDPSQIAPDIWMEFEPRQTDVMFKVRACSNAFIELTENRWTTGEVFGYEIVLGKEANTISSISRIGFGESGRLEVTTPDVLYCEDFQYFWISWKGGHVEVGRGNHVGMGRFMDMAYDNPDSIRFISVTVRNQLERSVSWEFQKWKG